MIRQAFVLGAGLGKRLQPLTDDLAKPLVPIFHKPLITFALDHLLAMGVERFIINTHHLREQFEPLFEKGRYRGRSVMLVHEPVLLETGGGIKNVQELLGTEPFIVYSGDVLTDLNLEPLIEEHFRAANDVTLALRKTGVAANVAFHQGRVVDLGNRYGILGNFDYANVSVWNPAAFARFSSGKKISFVPVLAEWIGAGGRIGGVVSETGRWFNLTSPREYLEVHRTIAKENWRPGYLQDSDWPVRICAGAKMEAGSRLLGFSAIGPGCCVGEQAEIEDSILWSGAQIAPCARLKRCIIRTHREAGGELADTII